MKALPWLAANLPGYLRFRRALATPEGAQRALLRRTLRANADTAFGRAFGFAGIRTAEEYRERVPLLTAEELAPWVERIAAGEAHVLTRSPVRVLQPTSGTSAAAKLIPYTTALQGEIRKAVAPWLFDLYARRPRLALGTAYWSITPLALPAEQPAEQSAEQPAGSVEVGFGEDSEYLGGLWRRWVDATLAVPGAVRHVQDPQAFRYATLLFLLRRRDLSLISVWHPSFLILLLEALPGFWAALLGDIERGTLTPPAPIPEAARRQLASHLAPRPRRAAELRRLAPDGPAPNDPVRLWPRLGMISAWGDAHAALSLPHLARAFPGVEIQAKGLIATEGFVTIPFAGARPLAVRSHVFEFLPEEGGGPRFAWELEEGRIYSVVLTTGGGLYRYRLQDRVQVEGFLAATPSLRFLGKEGHTSDLCGEKLHESFVAEALARLFGKAGIDPPFALLAPADADQGAAGYVLYLEAEDPLPCLAGALDEELSANPHYRLCRALGQLAPVRLQPLAPGAYGRYLERCRWRGQRWGDVKPVALSPLRGWGADQD